MVPKLVDSNFVRTKADILEQAKSFIQEFYGSNKKYELQVTLLNNKRRTE